MLDKLERKIGKYAIHNLMLYVLGGYFIGYMLQLGTRMTGVDYLSYLCLEPAYIIHNLQIWRLVTWVIIPPSTSIIWALFMFLLYYQLGNALENSWGSFRFNIYILGGMFLTLISAFVVYGVHFLYTGTFPIGIGDFVNTYYINMSIFLAFSVCFPDMQVMLYFIIPIKMKWMAIFYCVIIGYEVVTYIISGHWYIAIPILASLFNFLIFFLSTRNYNRVNPKEIHRRNEFKRQAATPRTHMRDGSPIARHKCAVCDRTEITNPELEFRFCSKCNGNFEYCSQHLFTHTHVK